jgi:protein gp37
MTTADVWIGKSIENDDYYTWRADFLPRIPAAARFRTWDQMPALASLTASRGPGCLTVAQNPNSQ